MSDILREVSCSHHYDKASVISWVRSIKRKILFVWNVDCSCPVQVHLVLPELREPQASLVGVDFPDLAVPLGHVESLDQEVHQDLQEAEEVYEDHQVVQAAQVCLQANCI